MQAGPRFFAFSEKGTGATRFKVQADRDGKMPIEEAASLLAMHCLVRGHSPSDYMVLVEAEGSLVCGVAKRAAQLLAMGRTIAPPLRLTRREEEVLRGILENLANKEIAARLYLSERTVKFHVSSLLAKFRVRGRVALMREAGSLFAPANSFPAGPSVAFPARNEEAQWPRPLARGGLRQAPMGAHVVRMPRRRISA